MMLDMLIEIKVQPPIHPFEQSLDEGAYRATASQFNQ
jgi:hypothetical protein